MTVLALDVNIARDGFRLDATCSCRDAVTGLIGRSGSGKTSLLHAICGLVTPTRGSIRINGRTVFDATSGVNLRPEQRRIGMVFQDARLFPHLSVSGNLRYGRRHASTGRTTLQFDTVVDLLELSPLLRRRPHQLSGGEQRRTALGRALLSGPELLLLDEPLVALDERMKAQIIPLLRRVRDECAIPMLYVCHDIKELLQFTNHAVVLADGGVVGCGLLRDVARQSGSVQTVHDLGFTNVLRCQPAKDQNEPGVLLLHVCGENGATESTVLRGPAPTASADAFRLAIRPQDIALAPKPIDGISIQNQLPGRVVSVTQHAAFVIVEIDIGAPLLVTITERARAAMNIEPGSPVCCLIKSTAIEYLP